MFNKFLKLISHHGKLNELEVNYIKENVLIRSYKKNEIFFNEGRVSKTVYFVLKGCVRLYYNVEGNDKTAFFYTEGKFINAGESYTFNIPAKENYQAIEDTVLMHFDKKTVTVLLQSPKFEHIVRLSTEEELIKCQQLITSFITLSPEERYIKLLKTNSTLFQRVPQQYIASFLGVSPETLSRIKKRVFIKIKKYILDDRQEFLPTYHLCLGLSYKNKKCL